jgi:hypothetical protein
VEAKLSEKSSVEQVSSDSLPPDVEVGKESLIRWMQKLDEGIKITQMHLADNNRILEKLLVHTINMQEEINELKQK